ncbi:MAG: hypothetical protein Q8O10_10255 [candidate division Zixibacteria bacterium]|nr:hypothetical protein [candidate division Zixibacteria bacterium]
MSYNLKIKEKGGIITGVRDEYYNLPEEELKSIMGLSNLVDEKWNPIKLAKTYEDSSLIFSWEETMTKKRKTT